MKHYGEIELKASSKEKRALASLKEGALKERFVRGARDPSTKRE